MISFPSQPLSCDGFVIGFGWLWTPEDLQEYLGLSRPIERVVLPDDVL